MGRAVANQSTSMRASGGSKKERRGRSLYEASSSPQLNAAAHAHKVHVVTCTVRIQCMAKQRGVQLEGVEYMRVISFSVHQYFYLILGLK